MRSNFLWSVAFSSLAALASGEEKTAFQVHGQSWFEAGRIMQASDTLINGAAPDNVLDLNGNVIQSVGAQVTVDADLGEHLQGVFGFGVQKVNHALGKGSSALLAISLYQNFLTQSSLTYFVGDKAEPSLTFTGGNFSYKYNPDVKNLGLYLLRGPVYPGILLGGFQDFAVDSTKGTMLGLKAHQNLGFFSHDLILNCEREVPPTLDWSLAYLAKVQAGAFQVGAGVNFYRLIAYDSKLETPGHLSDADLGFHKDRYIEVKPGSTDTTFFTHQGTKVMGMFSLDFQRLFGAELSNPDDLKLYGEAAVIGLQNYGTTYNDIKKRIPVMLGFNFPTGGLLTHLSMEVEYYGAVYRNDLARIGNNNVVADWTKQNHPISSPKPVDYSDYGIDSAGNWVNSTPTGDVTTNVKGTALDKQNVTKDDLKWSLFMEKSISKHISFMGQLANDHFRPKPVATGLIKSEGGTQEAFASTKDWYFMVRMGYFF